MPRQKGDGDRLYVGRAIVSLKEISSQDWDEIYVEAKVTLPPAARRDLTRVIKIYAENGPGSICSKPIPGTKKTVELWIARTNQLTNSFRTERHSGRRQLTSANLILRTYFSPPRYSQPIISLNDLSFMLEGAAMLARSLFDHISRGNKSIEYWLVWAALLLAVLRKHKIPYARYRRSGELKKEFNSHVIDLILALQRRQPHLKWARKTPESIRKALRKVVPYTREYNIDALEDILKRWGAGDFALPKRTRQSSMRSFEDAVVDLLHEIQKSKISLEHERKSEKNLDKRSGVK